MSKTVLSVRDFAILYNVVNEQIRQMENVCLFAKNDEELKKRRKEHIERLKENKPYQDFIRIREQLGNLQIEIETPSVEIKEEI